MEDLMWPPMWSESRTSITAMEEEVAGEVRRVRRWAGGIRGRVAIVNEGFDIGVWLCWLARGSGVRASCSWLSG